MSETWTVEQTTEAVADGPDPEIEAQLRRFLTQGKGIAVYRNEDLGHRDLGHCVAFTYGTPEAQFEPAQYPDGPPERCPDGLMPNITGGINWRYQLVAIVPPEKAD